MAKDKYTLTSVVDLIGTLDYNQNEELMVFVESGKGENVIVNEIDLMAVLSSCVGRQISLKLSDEKDKCNE